MFSVLSEINMLVWTYGLMLGGLTVSFGYYGLTLLGIRKASGETTAVTVMNNMIQEASFVMAGQAFSAAILSVYKESWIHA